MPLKNPAWLFHDFQNVKWFVQHWMICNYNVDGILTTLNNLYYVEWCAPTWIICASNVECVLTMLKDLHCCWMIWTDRWNFLLENIPRKIASEFSLLWKSQQWTLPHKPPLPCRDSFGNNCFATNEKTDFKI